MRKVLAVIQVSLVVSVLVFTTVTNVHQRRLLEEFDRIKFLQNTQSRQRPRDDQNEKKRSPYAYAYVIGGVKPENPGYRDFLYDMMVSTHIQRKAGSIQDVVVMVQMSYASQHDVLPTFDQRLLDSLNIEVRYIPKTREESFYRIMLDKFRIFTLPYSKVLFMDADVMARTNLDYLFGYENMVIAGYTEPANGGFFMLENAPGHWKRILEIIKDTKARGASLPYPHFDPHLGWGKPIHNFTTVTPNVAGNEWNFHGAFADQGLLYYWVMNEVETVTIVFHDHVKLFRHGAYEKSAKLRPATNQLQCFPKSLRGRTCLPPHSDFVHFMGRAKPWLKPPPPILNSNASATHLWYETLMELDETFGYGIDFSKWNAATHGARLGKWPTHSQMLRTNYVGEQ